MLGKEPNIFRKIVTGVGLGVALAGNPATAQQSIGPTESGQTEQLKQLSEQQAQVVAGAWKLTVAEIREIEKKWKIEIQVDNGDGFYITHVGQTHARKEQQYLGPDSSIATIENQKAIYEFLLQMNTRGSIQNCVYSEGFAEFPKEAWNKMRDSHLNRINLNKMLTNRFSESVGKTYTADFLDFFVRNFESFKSIDIYHNFGEEIFAFLELVTKYVEENKINTDDIFKESLNALHSFKKSIVKKYGEPSKFRQGATRLLFLDLGTPVICPTEHPYLNKAANEAVEKNTGLGKYMTEYLQVFKKYGDVLAKYNPILEKIVEEEQPGWMQEYDKMQDLSVAEAKPFLDRLLELKPLVAEETRKDKEDFVKAQEYKKFVHTLRDRFAIVQIQRTQNSFYVLGEGHELVDAVRESNATTPNQDPNQTTLGLIKMSLK